MANTRLSSAEQTTPYQSLEIDIQSEASIGGYAYQIVRKQTKQISKLRSSVIADTDPENLHQMRVGTRRLRSALDLFSEAISIDSCKGNATVSKAVKKLTKALGKVRDLDVMQQWFEQVLTPEGEQKKQTEDTSPTISLDKKERKTVKKLLKTLKKRRKKQFSKLKAVLKGKAYKKPIAQFKQWVEQPTFLPPAELSAEKEAIRQIVSPMTEILSHPGWLLATQEKNGRHLPVPDIELDYLNQQLASQGEQLHELRKQIKQLRYQTEFFRGLYGITYAAQVREFRTIQKILGQLQDQVVVSEFLADTLGEQWADKLPSIYQSFQDSRVALWQQWQPYQKRYLKLRSTLPPKSSNSQVA